MKSRIVRAIVAGLVAGTLLLAGAAPFCMPGHGGGSIEVVAH